LTFHVDEDVLGGDQDGARRAVGVVGRNQKACPYRGVAGRQDLLKLYGRFDQIDGSVEHSSPFDWSSSEIAPGSLDVRRILYL
jgi:hypothetical protein